MIAALYLRVSTDDQSTDLQRRELTAYAERRGWSTVVYEDEGVSGATVSRPALDRLMPDAAKRQFDVVCVWRFDRFARSVLHLLNALETFRALNIAFVSYSESIDTTTPLGRLTFTLLAAVGELERSVIVERVRAGQRAAKARGVKFGRPRAQVYDQDVADMLATGLSMQEVGAALNVSPATVCRRVHAAKNRPQSS